MRVKDILETWQCMNELKEGGDFPEEDWSYREWVPFISFGGGDNLCLDTVGIPKGHAGQIVDFCHEVCIRSVQFASLNGWLETIVVLFEQGNWAQRDQPDYYQNYRALLAVMNPGYPIEIEPADYSEEDEDQETYKDTVLQYPIDPARDAQLRKEAEQFRQKPSRTWWQFWRH